MRIRRFTPAVSALFNFAAGDSGRPFSDITHRLQYPDLAADVASVLASPESPESPGSPERINREVASDTGESYIVRINRYRSLDGGHDGAVLTFFENTAQHRVEEQLREAMVAAESANLAKGTFLSTLSHEFRTPLTAIMGYAELLQLDGRLDAAQDHRVERIKAGSRHLAAMIEEILSFAKLDGGHVVIEDEPADARTLAREAGLLVEPAAAAKGLAFGLDVPETPVPLVTDHAKARQILINLCGNAVKYTEVGEVRLGVRADGENVRFKVSDTGVGIAAEHHDRIFERFWQVSGGSTRLAGGMGIGLAAAREYARLLGGDVTLQSQPGIGSSFHLTLPGPNGGAH
jgi:signal transduction histidine kinase